MSPVAQKEHEIHIDRRDILEVRKQDYHDVTVTDHNTHSSSSPSFRNLIRFKIAMLMQLKARNRL